MRKKQCFNWRKLLAGAALTIIAVCCLGLAAIFTSITIAHEGLEGPTVVLETNENVCSGVNLGEGLILTAAHCLEHSKTPWHLVTDKGAQAVEILWNNSKYDVALFYVPNTRLRSAALDCHLISKGSPITSVGNPLGYRLLTTKGIVLSGIQTNDVWNEYILADITVAPGVSGGPVFDSANRVAGIVVGMYIPFNYAMIVPSPTICKLLGRGELLWQTATSGPKLPSSTVK